MKRALVFVPYIVPYTLGVVAIWLVSSMERPPIPEPLVFWNSDKLLHMLAYAILASLALFGVRRLSLTTSRTAAITFAMSALYGAVDEVHQSFVPGRSSSWLDLVADSMGAAIIAIVFLLSGRLRGGAGVPPARDQPS